MKHLDIVRYEIKKKEIYPFHVEEFMGTKGNDRWKKEWNLSGIMDISPIRAVMTQHPQPVNFEATLAIEYQ